MLQQASTSIGAIAAALAKAQTELLNPEKSLTATLSSPGEPERTLSLRAAVEWPRHHQEEPRAT